MHPLWCGVFLQSDGNRHLLVHGKAAKTDAADAKGCYCPSCFDLMDPSRKSHTAAL